jgi:hypothetical protein
LHFARSACLHARNLIPASTFVKATLTSTPPNGFGFWRKKTTADRDVLRVGDQNLVERLRK